MKNSKPIIITIILFVLVLSGIFLTIYIKNNKEEPFIIEEPEFKGEVADVGEPKNEEIQIEETSTEKEEVKVETKKVTTQTTQKQETVVVNEKDDDDEPSQPSTPPQEEKTAYEKYMDLSEEEKINFRNSFASFDDFLDWFDANKAEYDKSHMPIESEDGKIKFIGENEWKR